MNPDDPLIKTWDLYFPPEDFTLFNTEVEQIMNIRGKLRLSREQLEEIAMECVYHCPYSTYLALGEP